jgi:hypothetical protein
MRSTYENTVYNSVVKSEKEKFKGTVMGVTVCVYY